MKTEIVILVLIAFCCEAAGRNRLHKFSRDNPLTLDLKSSKNEKYEVQLPCSESVWFKLFLNGAADQGNMHVELFDNYRGNIYCRGGGSREWYDGERTDFTLSGDGLQCKNGKVIVKIIKTATHVTISSAGSILYVKRFSGSDGNCRLPSSELSTQVWEYSGNLYLSVASRSPPPRPRPPTMINLAAGADDDRGMSIARDPEEMSDASNLESVQLYEFSKNRPVTLGVLSNGDEKYEVHLPCSSVWFKLFLNGEDDSNMHIELFDRRSGNIYCKGAGSRDWYDGQRTDFRLSKGGLKCEDDGLNSKIIVNIHKTADHVAISNKGKILYLQEFDDNDANCRMNSHELRTQVWRYTGSLSVGIYHTPSVADPEFEMYPFSQHSTAVLGVIPHETEQYEVHLPCFSSVWFKLFLNGGDESNMHIELFDKQSGNIYCKGAGYRDWYDGQRTDFRFSEGGLMCENGGSRSKIIVKIEKTADHIAISNANRVIYVQEFSDNDGNCRLPSHELRTQVWSFTGTLTVGIPSNRYEEPEIPTYPSTNTGVKMYPFSKDNAVTLGVVQNTIEQYEVHVPCSESVWFKLFLNGKDDSNMHIELFDKYTGNIYCKGAGYRDWYDGERTDFRMMYNGLECREGQTKMVVHIYKDDKLLTISNADTQNILYYQTFGQSDGNCRRRSFELETQVWDYTGAELSVGILHKSESGPTDAPTEDDSTSSSSTPEPEPTDPLTTKIPTCNSEKPTEQATTQTSTASSTTQIP